MYKHNFHPSILREYDIRGIINETLFEKDAFMIGYFFGLICKEKNLNNETNIVISMDGRLSSPGLKKQTISGLSKSGCNVIDLGLNPTPILYFGSHNLNADGAIQITGSHNPKNYNGFKMMIKNEPFFGKDIQNLGIKAKSGSNINMNGTIDSIDLDEKYIEKILMPLSNAKNLKGEKKGRFRFHHVSTDEVYGSVEDEKLFTESSPYNPSSPYAASKASSDHLVRAWYKTYELPILISTF